MQGDVDSLIANYMLLLYKVSNQMTDDLPSFLHHGAILQHDTEVYESAKERGGREVVGDDEERMVKNASTKNSGRTGQGRAGKMFQPKRSGDSVTDEDL